MRCVHCAFHIDFTWKLEQHIYSNVAKGRRQSIYIFLGKATGVVTTTTITHATPASSYAHAPVRFWEAYLGDDHEDNVDAGCFDIAQQLVKGTTGKDLNVSLKDSSLNTFF